MSDELTPITRKETFLAKAGGQNVVTPTPITREETFLQAIIDNGSGGGGGGTGGGVLVVNADVETGIFDKTWKEINDASFVVIKYLDDNTLSTFLVVETSSSPIDYLVKCIGATANDITLVNATTSTENDYPVFQF